MVSYFAGLKVAKIYLKIGQNPLDINQLKQNDFFKEKGLFASWWFLFVSNSHLIHVDF